MIGYEHLFNFTTSRPLWQARTSQKVWLLIRNYQLDKYHYAAKIRTDEMRLLTQLKDGRPPIILMSGLDYRVIERHFPLLLAIIRETHPQELTFGTLPTEALYMDRTHWQQLYSIVLFVRGGLNDDRLPRDV